MNRNAFQFITRHILFSKLNSIHKYANTAKTLNQIHYKVHTENFSLSISWMKFSKNLCTKMYHMDLVEKLNRKNEFLQIFST